VPHTTRETSGAGTTKHHSNPDSIHELIPICIPARAPQTLLSPLEVKLGLVHITETLSFLGEAGLAHCGLTPSVSRCHSSCSHFVVTFEWSRDGHTCCRAGGGCCDEL
jgi:hypothetical protein